MNNIKVFLVAAVAIFSTLASSQENVNEKIKLVPLQNHAPAPLVVFQDSGIRTGLALPTHSFQYQGREFAKFSVWTLRDSKDSSIYYLGYGVSMALYRVSDLEISLAAGYSSNINSFASIKRSDWGVGFQVAFKY